ncbi:hypothetical protein AB0M57_25540 [Streptomyces sp. NPDC051597]|uniref:hypothetical protein n=1 Tax=Streptomyces sp. NPDC051597 TaxID=3155049 RepID=UPI003441FE2E
MAGASPAASLITCFIPHHATDALDAMRTYDSRRHIDHATPAVLDPHESPSRWGSVGDPDRDPPLSKQLGRRVFVSASPSAPILQHDPDDIYREGLPVLPPKVEAEFNPPLNVV